MAKVKLNWLQRLAPNSAVADRLRELGFDNVISIGEGSVRQVTGRWQGADVEMELPEQIQDVKQL